MLTWQGYRLTGLGVAPHARRTEVQREAAEAANLDALARGKGMAHLFEHALDGKFHIAEGKVGLAPRQRLDQFRLGHGSPGSSIKLTQTTGYNK